MERKPRPLLDLLLGIAVPALVLLQFSDDASLGAGGALLLALAFPFGWGLYDLLRYRDVNYIALLGLVSVVATGGIGLLQLDTHWLAVKEAAIPALLGTAILVSARLGYPLVKGLLYNPRLLDTEKISRILRERGRQAWFERRLARANWMLGATFFFSAAMNYLLASWIVVSPAGSAAFNEELARLTLVSYPVIAAPSMLMTLAVFYWLWRGLRRQTGLELDQLLAPALVERD